jgi:hypothetical protein
MTEEAIRNKLISKFKSDIIIGDEHLNFLNLFPTFKEVLIENKNRKLKFYDSGNDWHTEWSIKDVKTYEILATISDRELSYEINRIAKEYSK